MQTNAESHHGGSRARYPHSPRPKRAPKDEILHIRIDSEVKEAFFTLAAQRGVFASELLLELIEGTLDGPA